MTNMPKEIWAKMGKNRVIHAGIYQSSYSNTVKYVRADTMSIVAKTELPFEIYPTDLHETMTYVDAVKAVEKLNRKHATTDWRIPTLEELILMYKYKDEISGFCTLARIGSDFPDWYWSSTENRGNSSFVHGVRFSDGYEYWGRKDDNRLSCRPVRLVAAAAPTPAPPGETAAKRKRRS